MAEVAALAASVIAITTLAYTSSKSLYEFIKDIRDAPKSFSDLKADIEILQLLLESLAAEIKGNADEANIPAGLRKCLEEIKPSLLGCSKSCLEFRRKLSKITSHSDANHTSLRDSVKLKFQDKEIRAFRYQLASYKATLDIAVTFSSLKYTSLSTEANQKFEASIENTMGALCGQMQGLEIAMQAVSDLGEQKQEVMQAIAEHNDAIAQCLKVCTAALSETTATTGNTIKYARAFDDAKQVIGTIGDVAPGGPANSIDVLIAQDRAKQMAGSIAGNVALDFMNAPVESQSRRGVASSSHGLPPMPR